MKTPIIPQEIYLLGRYTSVEYFGVLRDIWGEMIAHLDKCLIDFMSNPPIDYRSRPLPEQAGIVWGEHVIPNFRESFESLCKGYIKLSRGDISGLKCANGPTGDFKGQMDFWSGWMNFDDENIYRELLHAAVTLAGNINFTEGAYWNPRSLSDNYCDSSRGELSPPEKWPEYRLRPERSVNTGSKVIYSGIYLPQIESSCAQFLSTDYSKAPEAYFITGRRDLLHPTTGEKYAEEDTYGKSACTWIQVERIPVAELPPL